MNIRPISDLRNKYGEVEKDVRESGPVFLTKNGYGSMVVMSMEQFEHINGSVEDALDAADKQAADNATLHARRSVLLHPKGALLWTRRPSPLSCATFRCSGAI